MTGSTQCMPQDHTGNRRSERQKRHGSQNTMEIPTPGCHPVNITACSTDQVVNCYQRWVDVCPYLVFFDGRIVAGSTLLFWFFLHRRIPTVVAVAGGRRTRPFL